MSARGLGPRAWIAAALVAGTFAVYGPVLRHEFLNYDDDLYVTDNPHVRGGLSLDGFRWAWTATRAANWHPLSWLSHMLDCELYGLDPAGHHLTSLLLHAANAVLLFLVLDRMTGAAGRSAVVAGLFAVHPLHVESVAWVAERKDVLSTLFGLAAIAAYQRYVASPGPRRYLPVVALLALGLAAKPMLVTLPLLLLLLDVWPLGRFERRPAARLVLEKLPLCALAAASGAVTLWVQETGGATGSIDQYPLGARLANAATSYVVYAWNTLWPTRLAVFYPHPGTGGPAWRWWGCLGLLLVALAAALRLRRSRPYLLVGWLWYVVTLLPVIGLVQVGEQARADRYTYVPLIGLGLALVWGLGDVLDKALTGLRLSPRLRRPAGPGAAAVALVALAVAARLQVAHWRDSATLFGHALEVTEDNHTAHLNLALDLSRRGELEEAIAHLRETLRLRPDYAAAHNNLGVALDRLGRPREAFEAYEAALRHDPRNADAHFNLALALASQGQVDAAIAHLERVVEIDPDRVEAHYNLGTLIAGQKRWDAALAHLSRAVAIAPEHARAHYNLGAVLFFMGQYARAWEEMKLSRRHGYEPPEDMLERLRSAMPEPTP